MSEFIGREIDFAVAVEGTRGVAEAVADRTVRKVECNIIPRAERKIDDSTFGRLEDSERVRKIREWTEGDVTGIVHADVLGYFLTNLYGDVATSANGSAYDHEFTLDQTILHPTLTAFVKDAGVRQEKVAKCVISKFELDAKTDDYVRFTASFLGSAGVSDSSTIPALATEYDFIGRDITVKIASSEAGLTGATALKLKTLKVVWNANAEADYTFGSYSPDNIYNKQFSIEVEFEKNYVDQTFEDMYKGSDFVYMNINIKGEAEISTGVNPELNVLLNKVQLTDWSRTSAGDALSTESVKAKAFLNTDDSQQSLVTLTNLTSAYIGS